MGKEVAVLVAVFVFYFCFYLVGLDAEDGEASLAVVKAVGNGDELGFGGAVDEAFCVEGGGRVAAGLLGGRPTGGLGDVVDLGWLVGLCGLHLGD